MESKWKNMMLWIGMRTNSSFMALMMVLSLLAGCGAVEKIKSDLTVQESHQANSLKVERLQDGREGFIIMENPQMDETSRRDFDRAVLMMEDEQYEQAADLLEKIIETSPGVTAPYINLAIACHHLGDTERAEDNLKTALDLIPAHPVACNEYGQLLRRTGKFSESRAIYQKGIAGFPDYYPLHKNLGILCDLYLNDPPCALEHYEIYSKALPEDKQVKLWIADLRLRLEQN
jgi:Tfp pilus assembly protein PilF